MKGAVTVTYVREVKETDEGRELRKWFAHLPREEQKRLYFEALASRGYYPPRDR